MYMCMCSIYLHIYIYTYIHLFVYSTCIYNFRHMHIYIYTYIHIDMYIVICLYTNTWMYKCIYIYTYIYVETYSAHLSSVFRYPPRGRFVGQRLRTSDLGFAELLGRPGTIGPKGL